MVDSSFFETISARRSAEARKLNMNALDFDVGTRPWRLKSDGLVTYKRRRNGKVVAAVTKFSDQSVSQPGEKEGLPARTTSTDDCSLKPPRNIILKQICQLMDSDHALKDSLQNALEFNPKQNRTRRNGPKSGTTGSLGMTSSGSVIESKNFTLTEICKSTFSDVIMSEKFAQLCNLVLENFQGLNAEKLFNLNNISGRMKEGVYETSPLLFQSDIQEILIKFEKVGSDITALAKGLSDKAISSFREQMSNSLHNFSDTGKSEFFARQSDIDHGSDQTAQTSVLDLNESHICLECTSNAVGRNSLVCDSCEGMYHISCIKPTLKEIPITWYCPDCTTRGTKSSHNDCTACERLDATESQNALTSSNNSDVTKVSEQSAQCKNCRTDVKNKEYRICGNSSCSHKFYHTKCLTSKQLISYGPYWYCPSCLCGSCFSNRDDDEIVRCDGCDHAYHTYCMQLPGRSTRPEGKWFCETCDCGIQRVQRARRLYEKISRKRHLVDGMIKSEMKLRRGEVADDVSGLEMV